MAVRGGARWEDEARSGWSHFLEHMVFKGAGDRDAQAIVEAIEAEGGSINATTGHERTSFEVRGLAGSLPTALEVVSDLMFWPHMDPAEIAREKDVIAQEIAEAFDTPDDHVFDMAGQVRPGDRAINYMLPSSPCAPLKVRTEPSPSFAVVVVLLAASRTFCTAGRSNPPPFT